MTVFQSTNQGLITETYEHKKSNQKRFNALHNLGH